METATPAARESALTESQRCGSMDGMNALRVGGAIIGCLAAGVAVAWVAFQMQQQGVMPRFFFPLLFPLLLGAVTGGLCVALVRLTTPSPRPSTWLVACLAGMVVVASQATFSYRFYVAEIESQIGRNPMAAAARSATEDFAAAPIHRFIGAQIRRSHGWWLIDAALTVAASVVVAGWLGGAKPQAVSERL